MKLVQELLLRRIMKDAVELTVNVIEYFLVSVTELKTVVAVNGAAVVHSRFHTIVL